MERLVKKYAEKLQSAGLCDAPLVCGFDDEVVWNRSDPLVPILTDVMARMNINSLICGEPAEPYRTILKYLVKKNPHTIVPRDCETRTFLHDLPVSRSFSAEKILGALLRRKSVVTMEGGTVRLVTFGTVSPEQAFVTFSSVCFAAFVLFFSDYLAHKRQGRTTGEEDVAYEQAVSLLDEPRTEPPVLMNGPFQDEDEVCRAMDEAGRYTVQYGLVDSYFGNISYRLADTVYISQTGSSLDELKGCIDPCPLDGSSCAGLTASSELIAHNEIYLRSDNRAILHGHPRFSVILSMDCGEEQCPDKNRCHVACPQERFIENIPIVPGEVGTGKTGLCHTLPPAIVDRRGVIVWGHGLFTVGGEDFRETFGSLLEIENMCRAQYFSRLKVGDE